MTLRFLITRAAAWGLSACLIASPIGEASVACHVPRVPEAARTTRGGGSAADRSRCEDLLRWLRTDTAADRTRFEDDTRAADASSAVRVPSAGDEPVPASPGRFPVRCRST